MFRDCFQIIQTLLPSEGASQRDAAMAVDWQAEARDASCWRCGVSGHASAVTASGCARCRDRRLHWDGVWRLGGYQAPLSDWIRSLKFRGGWSWAEFLGGELARITPDGERAVAVPVPLHFLRRWRRGYDQAWLLAKAFARAKSLPCASLLKRVKPTPAQSSRPTLSARRRNPRRAFVLRPVDLTGWTVWLIDDVCTTGATAAACARLLRRAGAARVNLAVPAVTDPWAPSAASPAPATIEPL